MIIVRRKKDLRLVLEATKRRGVQDAGLIACKFQAKGIPGKRETPAEGFTALFCPRRQAVFLRKKVLSYV
jgi:hypothetical protein